MNDEYTHKLRQGDTLISADMMALEKLADAINKLRAENERLKQLATCRCGDMFSESDPGTCGNCAVALRIENERLSDKAIRFDLDQAGIVSREKDAVELVDLRADAEIRRAEMKQYAKIKALLAYAAPSVDHTCYDPGDCKRCEINELLEAKP